MPCPPELVNYLIVQIANDDTFAVVDERIFPAALTDFPVDGTAGTSRWVRSKWRRTTDPLEESGWSNVLQLDFPRIQAYEIESLPDPAGLSYPLVPVISCVLGWSEFIELVLIANQAGEGCVVGYGVGLAATGRSWIDITNTSTDPAVRIVDAALIIGEPGAIVDCHGDKTIAAGWHPGDDFLAASSMPSPVSNYAPYLATPPVADISGPSGVIKYYGTPVTPPAGVVFGNPDFFCLSQRCPEAGDPGWNSAYRCINVFDVARTPAGFDLPGGGNYFVKVDAGICRAFGIYLSAGHTIFPPFMGVSIGTGHYAGFTQVGFVYVRFSTGFSIFQPAVDMGPQLGGIQLLPATTPPNLQLDDFFVFASETPFAADLGGSLGRWENAVIENSLPAGVSLVMVSRSTNHLVSNLSQVALDPDVTYYFRVGARRFQNLAQTQFLYSATLSEQAFGKLGSALALNRAVGSGTAEGIAASAHWKAPVATVADLPTPATVGDTRLVLDERLIYSFVNGLWRRPGLPILRVVGEIVFGVQTIALGSSRAYRPTVPKDMLNGVLTGWCLQCDTAGNGDTIFDIHKNGVTIFTNQANRPKLVNAQTKATMTTAGTTIDVTSVASEDDLTLDIDAVPSTVPVKVTAILYFRQDVREI